MDRTSRYGRAVQRYGAGSASGEVAPGKTALTDRIEGPGGAGGELAVPSHQWPAPTQFVGEQAARAHGLVQFQAAGPAVQLQRDALQDDLDELSGQSDGDVADDLVNDAARMEEARDAYQQGQAAYQARDYLRAGRLFEQAAAANRSERRSALYNAAAAYGRALRARDGAAQPQGQAAPDGQLSDRDQAALGESPGESAGAIADQETARADFQQGMDSYREGDDAGAAEGFEQSAARAPEAAGDLQYNAGMAHFRGGDYAAAVRCFKAALGLGEEDDGGDAPVAAPEGGAVQRQETGAAAVEGPDEIHRLAEAGTQGGGGELPHLDTIQRSFGRHDVSGIDAHVGGAAADAAQAMGARGYATGSSVAFEAAPDLFLAAHEAAHVVQQRGGVQLSGGVGEAGDRFEQHADAVAARVVAGQSAEDLLDQHAAGSGHASVQMDRRLQERRLRFSLPVGSWEEFRAAVEAQVARQVMSRTEVEQPAGGTAPIHRERELVDGSNLREVYDSLSRGTDVELRGRLIPSESGRRYEHLRFDVRDGTMQPITITAPAPDRCDPVQDDPLDPGRVQARRLAMEIFAARVPGIPQRESLMSELWSPTAAGFEYLIPYGRPQSSRTRGAAGERVLRTHARPGWRAIGGGSSGRAPFIMFRVDIDGVACRGGEVDRSRVEAIVDSFLADARRALAERDRLIEDEINVATSDPGFGGLTGNQHGLYRSFEQHNIFGDEQCLLHYLRR